MCEIFELWLQKLGNENLRIHVLKAIINLPSPEEVSFKIDVKLIVKQNKIKLGKSIEIIISNSLRTLKLFIKVNKKSQDFKLKSITCYNKTALR